MFKLDDKAAFSAPITVHRPVIDGYVEDSFTAHFLVLGDSEIKTYDFGDVTSIATFLKRVLFGFGDVEGADGEPLSFSAEIRDALIDLPYVRLAMLSGYFERLYKASAGN